MTTAVGLRAATAGAQDTAALAAALAGVARPGDVVLLEGGLGAGKTTFAQGFARALGVATEVTSPTFTLVHHYPVPGPGPVSTVLHADLYRLETTAELDDLALGELVDGASVALVEWGEAAADLFPDALVVRLAAPPDGPGGDGPDEPRTVALDGGPAWAGRREDLARALAPWGAR